MKRGRKILIIAAIITAIAAIATLAVGDRGFLDMYRLHKDDNNRVREIEAARAEIESLKVEIERLKNDTAYIEKIAREKMGMARKGEKIFKFVEENE